MTFIPIENKEVRGLTLKQLLWTIGGICSFIVFIVGTYFSILSKLNKTEERMEQMQDSFLEMKNERKGFDNSMNAKLNKLENQFVDMQIKQIRYELVLKDKGLMPVD